MQLLREAEVPKNENQIVFCASRLNAFIFLAICFGGCTALIVLHWPSSRAADCISAAIILFLFLGRRVITARFHPLNWLVRIADDGLYLHFRSYLNEGMPVEDPTVVFLRFAELRSACYVREKVRTQDNHGGTQTAAHCWVELELGVDPAPLATALDTEYSRPGVVQKKWYGSSTTVYRDYPVLMQKPAFVRIAWQVVPRASELLGILSRYIETRPDVKLTEDFAHMQGLPREQQEKRLRELNRRGETMAAVYIARRLYGYNLTQATNFVKGLQAGSRS
jgi:hypothetical protein